MSQSLLADKDGTDKSLLFELSIELMMCTEPPIGAASRSQDSKGSKKSEEEDLTITEAIEEFLASDFEIKVDPS